MKISCIIPTCDRNDFLIETIKSVFVQTLNPYEIIVVNNGKDKVNLPNNIKSKVVVFNVVRYAGAAQARNFGAFLATGDYLAFLDDDDLWSKDYLKNVSDVFKKEAKCAISRLDKIVDGKIYLYKNAFNKLNYENILIQNPGINGSNIAIKKDIFFSIGGFNPILPPSEDKALVLELIKNNIKIEVLPDNQSIIRMHKGERLSDAEKMIGGIMQFTRKYYKLMNRKQYLFNWLKIYRYRYQVGHKLSVLPYLFIKVLYYFLKLFDYRKKVKIV